MTLAHVSLTPYVLAHCTTSLPTDTLVMSCISFPLCPLPQEQTSRFTSFFLYWATSRFISFSSCWLCLSLLSTVFMPRFKRKDQANYGGWILKNLETVCRSVGFKERKAYSRWDDAFGYCEGATIVCAPRSHSHLIVCWTLIPRTVDSFLAWCLMPLSVSTDKGGGVGSRWDNICWHQTVGVTVYFWFISGCLVRERPVPGQKHQGEDLIEM